MRIRFVVLTIFLALLTPNMQVSAATREEPFCPGTVLSGTSVFATPKEAGVRMRAGGGLEYTAFCHAQMNSFYILTGNTEVRDGYTWLEVELGRDSDPTLGWVRADLVDLVSLPPEREETSGRADTEANGGNGGNGAPIYTWSIAIDLEFTAPFGPTTTAVFIFPVLTGTNPPVNPDLAGELLSDGEFLAIGGTSTISSDLHSGTTVTSAGNINALVNGGTEVDYKIYVDGIPDNFVEGTVVLP